MNIALIGYGKMGKEIEAIALERGHKIVTIVTSSNKQKLTDGSLAEAEVAIEFTGPDTAFDHVAACFRAGLPVVCGTTGWNDRLDKAKTLCTKLGGSFLPSSNFSVGVNLFFELNKKLAAFMNHHPEYDVIIEETHHLQKKDAPSGTAITLAEQAVSGLDRKQGWQLNAMSSELLSIIALREEGVPGTHKVKYTSGIDDLELIHTAHNRKGFALGAVIAAEFIRGKSGVFSMQEVLGL